MSSRPTPEDALAALEARGPVANAFRAGRSRAVGHRGAVASSHAWATLAGIDILRKGGGAMDAAVATAAALAVVEPMMTGIGGDAFFLYYDAASGRVHALNGSGKSPDELKSEHVLRPGRTEIETDSWDAVTVPGAVDAWCQGHSRFGRLPLADVLAPAIGCAEDGFAVSEVVAATWWACRKTLLDDPAARRSYLVDEERAPLLGESFRSPLLASSLRKIAEGGAEAFYRGEIAEEIVRYARSQGARLSMEDFSSHSSLWVEPLRTSFHGNEVLQIPPNGQGIAVLVMLNLLEGIDLEALGHDTPAYHHHLIEAKKLAYADAHRWVADPELAPAPIGELLSKAYAEDRRGRIDPGRAASAVDPGIPGGGDTVYLTAADEDGNAVSFINSLFDAFGAKKVGGDTGILLQNRGCGFSLEPDHPGAYAPGKRPFHTIIPGMVLRDGDLRLSYGLMGGPMQPQGHVQLLLSHLLFGRTIQEAVDAPRWRHTTGRELLVEHGTPRATQEALAALGHDVVPSHGSQFGGAQVIQVDAGTGAWLAASDPRKDGVALAF